MPSRRSQSARSNDQRTSSRGSRGGTGRAAHRRGVRPRARSAVAARTVPKGDDVNFAVIGLGYFAQQAVLPAFANAKGCRLAALISDDPVKLRDLGVKYDVDIVASYDKLDDVLASGAIDAVYIVLPNDLHAEFTIRAARFGIHVLCEKPLATTAADAQRMVEACRRAGVRLMTAYRLHFEPGNLAAIEAITTGEIGKPRFIDAVFSSRVKPTGIRVEAEHGGGPLYDLGVYCINAARYLFRAEPTSVFAHTVQGTGRRFREVEESVTAILAFPGDRVAQFTASFGATDLAYYTVAGTSGYVCLDEAFEYNAARHLEVEGNDGRWKRRYRKVDQVAPELMHFADCVRSGRDPEPSGKEGLIDVRIIEAIQRSAATGRRIRINTPRRGRRPTPSQAMRVGRTRRHDLVNATTPMRQE
jgi:predicted dehydrogenase